jgi:hypothetical protein
MPEALPELFVTVLAPYIHSGELNKNMDNNLL